MRNTLRLVLIASFILVAAVSVEMVQSRSGGIFGRTLRSPTTGCICHSATPNQNTSVSLSTIAKQFIPGKVYEFTITVSNPSAQAAGVNVASYFGALSLIDGQGMRDTTLKYPEVDDFQLELAHSAPKAMVNGKASFKFYYTAPMDVESDTIFANGNAVNMNGVNDGGDEWNFAPNFVVNFGSSSVKDGKRSGAAKHLAYDAVHSVLRTDRAATLIIVDAAGRTVRQTGITPDAAYTTSDLPKGFYTARLQQNAEVLGSVKFVR